MNLDRGMTIYKVSNGYIVDDKYSISPGIKIFKELGSVLAHIALYYTNNTSFVVKLQESSDKPLHSFTRESLSEWSQSSIDSVYNNNKFKISVNEEV